MASSSEYNEEKLKARFQLKEAQIKLTKLKLADVNAVSKVVPAKATAEDQNKDQTAGPSFRSLRSSNQSPFVFMYDIRSEIGCLTTVTVDRSGDREVLSSCDCDPMSICVKRKSILHDDPTDSDSSTVRMRYRPTKRVKSSPETIADSGRKKKPDELNTARTESNRGLIHFDKKSDQDRPIISEEFSANHPKRKRISFSPVKSSVKRLKTEKSEASRKNEVARIMKLIESKKDQRTVIFRDRTVCSNSASQLLPDNSELIGEKVDEESTSPLPDSDLRNVINLRNQTKQQENVPNENEALGHVRSRLGRQLSNEEFECALKNRGEKRSHSPPRTFTIPKKVKETTVAPPETVVYEAPLIIPVTECEEEEKGWPAYCPVLTNSHVSKPKSAFSSFPLLDEEMADVQDPGWLNFRETFLNRNLYRHQWNNQPTPVINHNLSVTNFNLRSSSPPKYAPLYDAQKRYYESMHGADEANRETVGSVFERRKRLAYEHYDKKIKKEVQVFEKANREFRSKYACKKFGIETVKYAKMKESERFAIRNSYEKKVGELRSMKKYVGERFDLAADEERDNRRKFHVGQFDEGNEPILEAWEVDELREQDAFLLKIAQAYGPATE